jgi:hypothetical protein
MDFDADPDEEDADDGEEEIHLLTPAVSRRAAGFRGTRRAPSMATRRGRSGGRHAA